MKNLEKMNKEDLLTFAKTSLKCHYVVDFVVLLLVILNIAGDFVKLETSIYSIALDVLFVIDCIVIMIVNSKIQKNK